MNIIKDIAGALVKPVADVFKVKEERKRTKEVAQAKITQAKINGEQNITLTDAEWESLSVTANKDSWKDEYLTIIITSPIVGLLAGGVYFAFTGDVRLLEGFNRGIAALKETGVDLGYLMSAVVLAGVGLKVWRSK
jgi:hypothetical protein